MKSSTTKKRSYTSSPAPDPASPTKRLYLHSMSPNVSRKTIYLNHHIPSSTSQSSRNLEHTFSHMKREAASELKRPPMLKPPLSNPRSKSSILLPSRSTSPKHKLRRTNSLISQGGSSSSSDNQFQSATTSFDRFIPSRHNSTSGKLQTSSTNPHPNASPETHIRAQTSKIYQHHVAEACGLDVNLRVLLYQPLPPERKKPINLFSQLSSSTVPKRLSKSSLRPAVASARAKKIPTAPERVLDAPGLVDDFYLNLLAWSSTNLLAIGLEDSVYVWNASTGSVGLLCELPQKTLVTSLRWSEDGSYISIGKDDGLLEIWDIETNTKLRTLNCDNHQTRIASQSWHQHVLTSGSRIGNIYHSDVRIASHVINKLENSHNAEICGIEYKPDGQQFVSGGNDNLVCIWDVRQSHSNNSTTSPLFTRSNHKAAVKALSWCPYQPSLLATGGGSSDKTINFWNTTTGTRINTIETGSQISSLNWGYASGTGMEIVATHGFPTNNISLFNYPTLQKTGEISGAHDSRILSGCLSPDNLTLATVAGDENLKFWSLFDLYKGSRRDGDRLNDDYDDESNLISNDDTKSIKKMMHIR
ncbi:WD40 repeat-like protein [Suhomyces tanzawaensis NRRL Y-17324]|uniref:WD40 repeat-like protein n=1 Tax=Suhomyces tanzawaensis NRRL Y-17324 TaxID=984487 RepID=A0A1E4SQK0_9ASCO|nr:WD40 repeat-like protein [Suhomyces tanzawaensis NRRL Y-17324]ODV81779.1 WD40 repeat-like protein [Suhomyces tanzawaensis NRRL Y-17324]